MDTFDDRLNKIWDRIISNELLHNKGLGNEIGFYIFDYPPEKEIQMREHIGFLMKRLQKERPDLRVNHIDLFTLMVEYLKGRNLLDKALRYEEETGQDGLLKALSKPLGAERLAKAFTMKAEPDKNDLILVSGVGKIWPLLRSHLLLNNLQPLMGGTPLVMFYPGEYSGQDLRLFSRLKEKNYYRAFRLI
ncbi:MAG: DUF1788 domain-containing protein [Thermodesulfobacteriota bacterium]|nr:DUF1788 domain-containing protein [Thermodesulfobacteriota bacterium]